MRSLLIVTQLDYTYFSNTRTHHMVEQFLGRFPRITVIYKAHSTGATVKEKIRSFFSCRVQEHQQSPFTLIEVSPLFNAQNGLGMSLLGLASPYTIPSSRCKRILRRAFSSLGFVLELAILPSLLLAYLLKDRGRYDVCIGEGVWAIVMGYVLKKTGRVRLLVSDDYDYAPGSQPISGFRRWYTNVIEVLVLKRSDLVFSVGRFLARLREEQTGKRIEVIPNGVNCELFTPAREKSPHPPTLIYTGAVEGWSGLDIIIAALAKVRDSIPGIRLLIIGHAAPRYGDELKALAKSYALDGNVEFLGMKKYSELPAYLRGADIGLAVSMPIELRKYAFSLKVIEYLSAGLPVIATRGTESGLLVEESGTGVAVEYESGSVAQAIVRLQQDREFYDGCSERALKTGGAYDWKNIMDRCYALIESSYEPLLRN